MPKVMKSQDPRLPMTVDEAFDYACKKLTEERKVREYGGPLVEVEPGKILRFPAEIKDETRINTLKSLFEADPTAVVRDWKVSEDVYIDMTLDVHRKVMAAGLPHINGCFTVERGKFEQLKALHAQGDQDAVMALLDTELMTGWPA